MVSKNKKCCEIPGKDVSGAEGERRRRKGEFVTALQRKNSEGKRKTLFRDFGVEDDRLLGSEARPSI